MGSFSGHTNEKIEGEVVTNNGFFPDIDLGDFQEKYRIDTEYRLASIKVQIVNAMQFVNTELMRSCCDWTRLGYYELSAVPSGFINAQHWYCQRYETAVMLKAKAELLKEYATMNRRDEAENIGKESYESYAHLIEQSSMAINDLKGTYQSIGIHAL